MESKVYTEEEIRQESDCTDHKQHFKHIQILMGISNRIIVTPCARLQTCQTLPWTNTGSNTASVQKCHFL